MCAVARPDLSVARAPVAAFGLSFFLGFALDVGMRAHAALCLAVSPQRQEPAKGKKENGKKETPPLRERKKEEKKPKVAR